VEKKCANLEKWEWFKPKTLRQWEGNGCFLEKYNLNYMNIKAPAYET